MHRRALDLLVVVLLAAGCAVAVWAAGRSARSAFLDLGPNDAPYVRAFRVDPTGGPDWERDGQTKFHWTTLSSLVQFPVHAGGEGFVLRARVRRHMIEPARVTLRVQGRAVHTFELVGGSEYAYKIITAPLPIMDAGAPFVVTIESNSADPRPLGIAIDWMELESTGSGRFSVRPHVLLWTLALVLVGYLAPRVAGAAPILAVAHAAVLIAASATGFYCDIAATTRIVETGIVPIVTLAALGLRLALLLHPRYFYPDVQVHAAVARELAKQGLGAFLQRLPAIQYRLSLGLQFENGHWYAFPYPPGFYAVCWPFVRFLGATPSVVVSAVAAAANALGVLLTFLLGWLILREQRLALIGAVAHAALPLFLIRSVLAYFPALLGQAVDAALLLFLVSRLGHDARVKEGGIIAVLTAASLLAYTQAVVNFGILVALFLVFDGIADRTATGRRRQAMVAIGALLGVVVSIGLFYGRYLHLLADIRQGTPMAEEQLLLQKEDLRKRYARVQGLTPGDDLNEDDPYAGPRANPLRGVRKAGWRLLVFYNVFALSVVVGLALILKSQTGPQRRFLIAWALTYLVLNLASGGLPSPNLLRYNKDLEVVACLCCAAFAATTAAMSRRSRLLATAHVVAFVAFGLWRGIDLWRTMLYFDR
jgi:hypothetical protein